MSQIEVSVYDQIAYFTHTPNIYSGGVGTDSVKFSFDDTWDDFNTKTAVFYNDPKKSYPVMLDSNNTVIIPATVINRDCKLYLGVMGVNEGGDVKTSSILSYHIVRGVISAENEVLLPNTDVWLQLLVNYEKAISTCDGAINTMNTRLNSQDDKIAIIDNRVIESAQENKANITMNNINDAGVNALLSMVNMDSIKNGETYSKHFIQSGIISGASSTNTVTFPKNFKSAPLILLSCFVHIIAGTARSISIYTTDITASTVSIGVRGGYNDGSLYFPSCNISWVAIGEPEE